MHGYLMMPCVI